MAARKILLLSGPNLSLLGERQPEIYGAQHLAHYVEVAKLAAKQHDCSLEHVAADHEGELVQAVQRSREDVDAIIVNGGALSHYGWSLRDALASFAGPIVELHISNPDAREPWRHHSVFSEIASGSLAGFGDVGYELAVLAVARLSHEASDLGDTVES